MRILALVPCDRVLNDPQQGVSLISAYQSVVVTATPDLLRPSNAVAPKEWAVIRTRGTV